MKNHNPYIISKLQSNSTLVKGTFIFSFFGEYTYEQINRLAINCAHKLKSLVEQNQPEDHVFIVDGDGEVSHIIFILASMMLGTPIVPLNKTMERSNLEKQTNRYFIKVKCSGSEVSLLNSNINVFYGDINSADSSISPQQYIKNYEVSERLAICFPTSGTTGHPKLIAVSNYQLAKGAVFVNEALGIRRTDKIAGLLSLDFDYGLNQLFCAIFAGASYICSPISSASTESLFRLKKNGPTILALMPFIIEKYLKIAKFIQLDQVRCVTSSGAPLTQRHRDLIRDFCPNATIIPMYGLSEAFRATISSPEIDEQFPGSVGLPIGDTEISIRDELGAEVSVNTVGEVWQSKGCMSWGYWQDVKKTRERFIFDDEFPNRLWLKSGDLGYLNEHGYLFIVGRKSFQIKKYGIRVSIDEVESAISKVLDDLVVVAVPISISETESDFDIFVEATPNYKDELGRKIQINLSREIWPRNIHCIESIPVNISGGKPDRQELLKKFNLQTP